MINDLQKQRIVEEYARKNFYTLLANNLGAIHYVKYENGSCSTIMLKWPKGHDEIIIEKNGKMERKRIEKL